MARRMHRPFAFLVLAGALASACTKDQAVMQSGLPLGEARTSVSLIAERGDYLDIRTEGGGKRYRFFVPDTEPCRALFVSERAVTFSNQGAFGRLTQGDATCDPVGVLSLVEWRNRGPRRQNASVIPRSRADLRQVVYSDDDLTLIRGRFLLAREIGFMGGIDSIAVFPKGESCEGIEALGSASMEFRVAGNQPFTLINGGKRCPVIGFVQAGAPSP